METTLYVLCTRGIVGSWSPSAMGLVKRLNITLELVRRRLNPEYFAGATMLRGYVVRTIHCSAFSAVRESSTGALRAGRAVMRRNRHTIDRALGLHVYARVT